MLIKYIETLGQSTKALKQSAHPCIYSDIAAVKHLFAGRAYS